MVHLVFAFVHRAVVVFAEGGVGVLLVLDRQMAVAFVAYSAAGNKWVFLSAVSVV